MANSLASGQKPTGVADLDSSQTLENKTLDSTSTVNGSDVIAASIQSPVRADVKKDTLANLQTYALTASNGQLCFATDAKKMYQVLDAALAEVGSGQGGINYISNPDFELNADGYTSDVNLTIARSTVAPLRGSASGVISKAAVDASGEVVKIPFTIESADLAKKLYISFDKDASDPNYADGDLRVEVIKDPNGTPVTIRCNAEDILGGKGSHLAWFQTDASILEYELVFKCNSSNASAYSVKIDNISVGPREVSYGSAMTDWSDPEVNVISATTTAPTKGAVAIDEVRYKRVGQEAIVTMDYKHTAAGTAGSGDYLFKMPSNLKIDTTKLNAYTTVEGAGNWAAADNIVGYGTWGDGGNSGVLAVVVYDEDYVRFFQTYNAAEGVRGSAFNGFSQTTNFYSVKFTVPIEGWSSNSIQSEDIGNREVRVRAAGNGGTSITANVTNIDFTEIEDTTNSWNGTQFTAPETGDYLISGGVAITAGLSLGIYAYLNNSIYKRIGNISSTSVGLFSVQANLVKGDTITIRFDVGATLTNNTNNHHIHIQKLAQPQTILETETVAARYTSNSGQSITSPETTFIYEDLDKDTHNAYNTSTGIYTVPVAGWYSVNSSFITNVTGTATTFVIRIWKNGATVKSVTEVNPSVSTQYTLQISDTLYLEKDDTIQIRSLSTGSTVASGSSVGENTFSIARIK